LACRAMFSFLPFHLFQRQGMYLRLPQTLRAKYPKLPLVQMLLSLMRMEHLIRLVR
jgi:hypothetical protein